MTNTRLSSDVILYDDDDDACNRAERAELGREGLLALVVSIRYLHICWHSNLFMTCLTMVKFTKPAPCYASGP
jgi:hypothetical protein